LPPYTPELQPAETLWTLVDEPIVNKNFETLADLDAVVAERCVALNKDRKLERGPCRIPLVAGVSPDFIDPDSSKPRSAVPGLTRDLAFPSGSRRSRAKPGTARFQRIGSDQRRLV